MTHESEQNPIGSEMDNLRAIAQSAYPKSWRMDNPDDSYAMNMYCVTPADVSEPEDENDLKCVIAVTLLQTGVKIGAVGQPWEENARFIATFDPATVLGLLDQIERLTQERDDLLTQSYLDNE